jgi:hypothetical protein
VADTKTLTPPELASCAASARKVNWKV